MSGDGIEIKLNPAQLAATLKAVKAFSPALATATRKRLRGVGAEIVSAMQVAVMGATGAGPKRLRGKQAPHSMRRGIAAGTKMVIVAGTTRQGISIVTSSAKLPPGKFAMVKAWNKPTFRHPVFGDRSTFVQQPGRPYFGSVAMAKKSKVAAAMQQVLDDAIREITQ